MVTPYGPLLVFTNIVSFFWMVNFRDTFNLMLPGGVHKKRIKTNYRYIRDVHEILLSQMQGLAIWKCMEDLLFQTIFSEDYAFQFSPTKLPSIKLEWAKSSGFTIFLVTFSIIMNVQILDPLKSFKIFFINRRKFVWFKCRISQNIRKIHCLDHWPYFYVLESCLTFIINQLASGLY